MHKTTHKYQHNNSMTYLGGCVLAGGAPAAGFGCVLGCSSCSSGSSGCNTGGCRVVLGAWVHNDDLLALGNNIRVSDMCK